MNRVETVACAISMVVARKALLDPEIAGEMAKMPPEYRIKDMAEGMWPELLDEAQAAIDACNKTVLSAG